MFTYGSTSSGVKYWLFLGKYRLKVIQLKGRKIKYGGFKTFQKRYQRNRECLNISNLVITEVAENTKYQSHGGSNFLLSVKSIRLEKEMCACHAKLF